jgi:hypothetical protein
MKRSHADTNKTFYIMNLLKGDEFNFHLENNNSKN